MPGKDIITEIHSKYSLLSKGHKRLADFVITDYDKVIFMNINDVSKIVGVSESTVVRFARSLGFSGYPSFQKNLQESVKSKLTTLQRFEHTKEINIEKCALKNIMLKDIENINETLRTLNIEKIKEISSKIKSANKVYIVGFRSSKVLAEYLAFYLKFIVANIELIPSGANDIYDELSNAAPNDLVIAISFPRYSTTTIDIVNFLKENKVPIVAITDSYDSPIASKSTDILTASFEMNTFVDSLVAPMSLLNALIIEISLNQTDELENKFKQLEKIWNDYKVYI